MQANRRDFIKGTFFAAGGYALEPLGVVAHTLKPSQSLSRVSLAKGDDRRTLTSRVLEPLREEIESGAGSKQIYIKINIVYDYAPLAVTHVDTLRGLLDFLSPLTDQKIIIGESTASEISTTECFDKLGYRVLEQEYNVQLLDLGLGPYTQVNWIKDAKNQVEYPYITSLVLDPTKYHIDLARMKTHSATVCTLAMKNYYMGSTLNFPLGHPLYSGNNNSRTLMHLAASYKGLAQNLVLMSMHFVPDLSIIDGFQGMEGDGPSRGTPVDHRVMVAGQDIVSVDRVGLELMGLDYTKVKHVQWASEQGVGQGNLDHIEIIGPSIDELRISYKKSPYYDQSVKFIDIVPIPDFSGVENTIPKEFSIGNYPNPFNTSTTIEFDIPSNGQAALDIYNMKGQRIRRLFSSQLRAGKHSLIWDARDDNNRTVSTGVYFLRLSALSKSHERKMLFLK
jgi:uncharacterized protein (DUF362 family)